MSSIQEPQKTGGDKENNISYSWTSAIPMSQHKLPIEITAQKPILNCNYLFTNKTNETNKGMSRRNQSFQDGTEVERTT